MANEAGTGPLSCGRGEDQAPLVMLPGVVEGPGWGKVHK